jgi:hypothetical protein
MKIQFSINLQVSNFMKIRPMGAELLHVDEQMDGQTDMTELKIFFGNFAKALKKDQCCCRLKSPLY